VKAFVTTAQQLGIHVSPKSFTFNQLLAVADDNGSPANDNQWGMSDYGSVGPFIYPTTDMVLNTTGSANTGDYSDTTADQLIHNSKFGTDPNALAKESNYLARQVPVIFQANQDIVWTWKNTLKGPANSFTSLSQYRINPEDWFLTR
jgi:peptide/nickel transport system substrate-binding protein